MKAVFQGEFHVSTADREALDSRVSDEVDALFLEQREDTFSPDRWSLGYVWFLAGAFTIFWVQDRLDDGPDVREQHEVPVHDEIDIPLPELYEQLPDIWKVAAGLITGIMFFGGLLVPLYPVPLVDPPFQVTIAYSVVVKTLMVTGAPLLYSFILIYAEERRLGIRDEAMATAIAEISEDRGYQTIVVSCGDAHLERLPDLLEEKGWETEVNESSHRWAAKFWRWR